MPDALRAVDEETLGGFPVSAFVLNTPPIVGATAANGATVSAPLAAPPAASNVTTSGGTANALPLWTTATNIQSSVITQSGTGATAKIGIGTMAPATTLDVRGGETVRGQFTLPASGTATIGKAPIEA